MQLKQVPILNDKDIENYRVLGSVIRQGKFDLEGKDIFTVGLLLKWYDDLESKLIMLVKKEKLELAKPKKKSIPKPDTKVKK